MTSRSATSSASRSYATSSIGRRSGSVNLDPPDEVLRRFAAYAHDLNERRIMKEGDLRASFNLDASMIGQRAQLSMHQPDEENLRSFLLDLRKCMSEREPVFINRVMNVAWRHITSDELADLIRSAKEMWRAGQREGMVSLVINDQTITPEHVVDLWINGYYFHDDADKRKRLEQLAGGVPLTRLLFLNAIVDATRVVLHTGRICVAALREGQVSSTAVR